MIVSRFKEENIRRYKDFLEKTPTAITIDQMSAEEKKEYFKDSDFGDWVWKDDEYSKEIKAMYHHFFGIYLGVDESYLRWLNLDEIDKLDFYEGQNENIKEQIKLQKELEAKIKAMEK